MALFLASLGRKLPRYGGEGASTVFFWPRPSWRSPSSLRGVALLAFALALPCGSAAMPMPCFSYASTFDGLSLGLPIACFGVLSEKVF